MRRVSRVLYRVGGIFAIVYAVIAFISTIVFCVLALPFFYDILVEGLKEGSIHSSYNGSPEAVATFIQGLFIGYAVICFVWASASIISAVVAFRGLRMPNRKIAVLNIIFGFISGTYVNSVGGIFGLIAEAIEEKQDEDVIDQ